MKHYGLIGYPLTHSFSERYFAEKFYSLQINASYKSIEVHSIDIIHEIVHHYQLDGFNVTIPYKEKIISFLDEIDPIANEIGAVNCVKVSNGKLKGYNTDIIGFEKSLTDFIGQHTLKALVFGTGGSSKAVQYVLTKMGIPFLMVSRNDIQDGVTYSDIDEKLLNEYQLFINTTPVGMFPNVDDKLPIPYHLIRENMFAFDLIYNPERTMFLKGCEAHGAKIRNGYEMLAIQADASYEIFL